MNAPDHLTFSVTPGFPLAPSLLLHVEPAKQADIEVAQLTADFNKLDAYGRRCALAMVKTMARLRVGAA